MLTEVTIANFKSLKSVSLPLRPMSFLCGPNGSGKTNVAEALDFLSHVFRNGLQYAVAEKGGFYNMCFRGMRRTKGNIEFRVRGETKTRNETRIRFDISFSLKTKTEAIGADFTVASESHRFEFDSPAAPAVMEIDRTGNEYSLKSSGAQLSLPGLFGQGFDSAELERTLHRLFRARSQELLLGPPPSFAWEALTGSRRIAKELEGLRVFQISPRAARQPGTPSIEQGMGRHGENLSIAVARFLSRRELAGRLMAWMQDASPRMSELLTRYTLTKQTGLFLQERGVGAPWYAEDLSDGTVSSLALFICLLEPLNRTVLIEEPENSLHPWLLKRFIERCREATAERQVILTTHSPLVVAMAEPEELFLVERHGGQTEIVAAVQRDPTLSQFIRKNVLDLGEYWLSGGIGAVPEAPGVEEADQPDLGKQRGDATRGEPTPGKEGDP